MSQESAHSEPEQTASEQHPQPVGDQEQKKLVEQRKTRRTTLVLLVIIVTLFGWYLVSDRLTPFTTAARVKAYVVPVVPDVSGYVAEIKVKKNQFTEAGVPLLQIDKKRFEIALERARAALEMAGQEVEADSAGIATAMAKLSSAQSNLENFRIQGQRIFTLESQDLLARAQADEARRQIKTAEAEVEAAEAELERARQRRGAEKREENPRMQAAMAALSEAHLNLERTTILSPGRGFVGGAEN